MTWVYTCTIIKVLEFYVFFSQFLFSFQSLCVNVALASPLLSRFDLVLVLLDSQNQDWDTVVSNFILHGEHPGSGDGNSGNQVLWSMDKMQAYISLIKSINPELTPGATR